MAKNGNILKSKQEESYFERKNREAILRLQQKQKVELDLPPTTTPEKPIEDSADRKESQVDKGFFKRLFKL
jgi:hypothetical protein